MLCFYIIFFTNLYLVYNYNQKNRSLINQNFIMLVSKLLISACCLLLSVAATHAQELRPASIVKKSSKIWGYEDENGKIIIEPKYEQVSIFQEDLAGVMYKGKWGFIDKKGNEVIPAKYESVTYFSQDMAGVKKKGKWAFIDKTGKEIIPARFENVGIFSEDLVSVKQTGKWGFIDKNGIEVISAKYEEVNRFNDGIAPAKLNDK